MSGVDMSQAARAKLWQRVIDCVVGGITAGLGFVMLDRFIDQPRHHVVLTLVWAALLTVSGFAIVAGSALRTVTPGHRQSIGFQFELCGWGGAACLIFWYALIDFTHHYDWALFGALLLVVTMLASTFMRMVAAMREGHRRAHGAR